MSIPRKAIDWKRYDALKAQGESDTAIAPRLGLSQPGLSHRKKTRHLDELTIVDVPVERVVLTPPVNGNLPAIPSSHSDALQRISALPVHYDASELDDLKSRLATLEAFMAAVQAQQRISALPAHPNAPVHRIAPERTEPPTWVNRGTHLAADMVEAVKAYATEHRMEIREVIDLALRRFFAGQEVDADA